jgi:hypothetical protein
MGPLGAVETMLGLVFVRQEPSPSVTIGSATQRRVGRDARRTLGMRLGAAELGVGKPSIAEQHNV